MLGDFFRINLPYGISRNDEGEWYAFNREYMPIGFNDHSDREGFKTMGLPIYTMYKGLTEEKLLKIAWSNPEGVIRNDSNEIVKVFLYNDRTNPMNQGGKDMPSLWADYFGRLKLLSKLVQKQYA